VLCVGVFVFAVCTHALLALTITVWTGKDDLIFTCMYSHERGPRAAREWARMNPGISVRVLRGGIQKLITHLSSPATLLLREEQPLYALLEHVNRGQWAQNGDQGWVWKPDLGLELLSDSEAAWRQQAGIPAPSIAFQPVAAAGKLLFLDCDGVLNTTRCLTCDYSEDDASLIFPEGDGIHDFFPLDRACLAQLKRIIDVTGARIVLSTTWRQEPAMREYLLQTLAVVGVREVVVGDTPSLSAGRGAEIAAYLQSCDYQPRACESATAPWVFAILEDDDKHVASFVREGLGGRCVQTQMDRGLTDVDADAVIRLLL
jgi:hypothetical protein